MVSLIWINIGPDTGNSFSPVLRQVNTWPNADELSVGHKLDSVKLIQNFACNITAIFVHVII